MPPTCRIDERSKQHEDPTEQLELRKLRRKLSQVDHMPVWT